jgi:hypothetical protein
MAPCRASVPLPFPARPRMCGATHACRRTLTPFHCIAGHPASERDAHFATRSAMNRKERAPRKSSSASFSFSPRPGGVPPDPEKEWASRGDAETQREIADVRLRVSASPRETIFCFGGLGR